MTRNIINHFVLGRIVWVRSLKQRLSYLMNEATDHPVLKVMPEMTDVQKKFAFMSVALFNYEEEIKNIWMNHNVITIIFSTFELIIMIAIHLIMFIG